MFYQGPPFLAGDVMIGRGIDRVLPRSVDPVLFERLITDAEDYVRLAVEANGHIPRPVDPAYVWGAALDELDRVAPDARIVNLETAVTTSADAWRDKEVLYRTHPANVAVLEAARIDCVSLANNHVLDWGMAGAHETIGAVESAGIATVGAGRDRAEAETPALIELEGGRVVVIGLGSTTSGIPFDWAARDDRPGVDLIERWTGDVAETIAARVAPIRRPGDIVVASIHWGSDWGDHVPAGQRRLARELVEVGGVDIVHGHSSHHPRGIELHRDKLIIHGCGDFITDYEGIGGYEAFRDDLVLAYWPTVDLASGRLLRLTMTPFQLRRFQLVRPSPEDVGWLQAALDRRCRPLGTRVDVLPDGTFSVSAGSA